MTIPNLAVRPIEPADLPVLVELNRAAVPAVNDLDEAALAAIVAEARLAVVVTGAAHPEAALAAGAAHPEAVLGFVVALGPGADYASENYRWFAARGDRFLYVDRIVVAEGHRGGGLGVVLYDAVFAAAAADGAVEVDCEVNVEPPNPGSLAFHGRIGFGEVGRQATKGGSVVVALLARPLAAD